MKKLRVILLILVAMMFVVGTVAAGGRPLSTTLTGAAEVPGPGDPDGSGWTSLTLNPGQREICFEIYVADIVLPATGAHIHVGSATESGPVVVGLAAPDATGWSSGCVTADRSLIRHIMKHPEHYYINVHNTEFPAGAVRGQLSK
jgi:hypothetical protein